MARSADNVGGRDKPRAADDGDAVVARPDDGVGDLDVRAARHVDSVRVGALVGSRDGQLGHPDAGAPGEGEMHLLAVPELEIAHAQAIARPECQRLGGKMISSFLG